MQMRGHLSWLEMVRIAFRSTFIYLHISLFLRYKQTKVSTKIIDIQHNQQDEKIYVYT